jgi:hypothetical protein
LGLLRRVESGIERVVGGVFGRSYRGHVEAGELAVKLVKEMEDRRQASFSREYLPNRFFVYLCPDDRAHFRRYERALAQELADHVTQHCRQTGCRMVAPAVVSFETDEQLKRGQFGIRAELDEQVGGPAERAGDAARPGAGRPEEAARAPLGGPAVPGAPFPPVAWEPSEGGEPPIAAPAAVPAYPPADPAGPPRRPGEKAGAVRPPGSDTESIPPDVAAQMGLARQTVVLSEGPRRLEFEQGRVVLGRGRQVDFQVDDPNVSRRHAVVYLEGGRLFLKDLGSTNGTLLNGRPVTAGPLSSGDVITVGATEIRVESG